MSMNNFTFNTTSGIRFGSGMSKICVEEISKKLGPNILFITDKGLMSLNLTEPTLNELSKYSSTVEVFQDVEADPSIKTLYSSIEAGKKINATGVIGFGGGSSMDVAKLTSLILGSNENIEEAWGVSNAKGPRLPLVLIPTTAGTGSEVTPISIITVGEEEKKGVSSSIILPDIAILDPDLTIGLPAPTTAATGIDAMVHAIEGYTSANKNNNPISKMLAIEALKLLSSSIEKAVFDGSNIEARGNMLIGAKILILDEPTSALGQKQQMEVLKTIKKVQRLGNIAIILITHNEIHARLIADRFTFLSLGEVIGSGLSSELGGDDVKRLMAGGAEIGDLAKELEL